MQNRIVLTALAAAMLPCAPAFAQEASGPPPVAPSDFRLPPAQQEPAPVEGPTLGTQPVRRAEDAPTPAPTTAVQAAPTPGATAPAPAALVERTPPPTQSATTQRERLAPDEQRVPANQSDSAAEPSTDATVSGEPAVTSDVGLQREATGAEPVSAPPVSNASQPPIQDTADSADGMTMLFVFLALLGLLALGGLVWFLARHRKTANLPDEADAPVIERPQVESLSESAAPVSDPPPVPQPEPAPPPASAPVPAPVPSMPKPTFDPAGLVSVKPRTAQRPAAPANPSPQPMATGLVSTKAPPSAGLVSTNLREKRRAEAEAVERARQQARERQSSARPVVKGSISFDWS